MTVYSKILSLINGVPRTVDFSVSGNVLGTSAIELVGSTSGSVTINASATGSAYSVSLPGAQGAASSFLQNDGSGNLTWSPVSSCPAISNVFTAGENFAANTSFVVRWAMNSLSETTDTVYKADYSTVSMDEFWGIGIAFSTTAVTAGQNITVYSFGSYTLGSSDTPFNVINTGDPVWLTTDGAFSVVAPSGGSEADLKIGIVMSTTNIWIDGQMMGIGGGGSPTELPLTVPEGGTGQEAFTPYAVIVGGTTSTGPLEQVSGLGTSGFVLTSNGAGANPTWQAASGGFTNPMTTAGDIIYENSTPGAARLGIGSTGQILTVVSGLPAWANAPATGVTSVAFADASTTPIYSISGSPVTSSGTLTQTLTTQSANTVFAGPSSGSAAQPTFRSLVAADIPSLSATYLLLSGGTMSGAINMGANQITNMADPTTAQGAATKNYVDTTTISSGLMTTKGDIIYENATPAPARLPIGSTGQILTVVSGVPAWETPATSGTVSSVGLADASTTPIYAISNSPITSTGNLTLTLETQTANKVFAGPSSGSAAEPTFRALVAADIPSLSATYVTQSEVGAANGVASLDSGGKVPVAQLPNGVFVYQGLYDPATNVPALADGTGTTGQVYYVSTAFNGIVAGAFGGASLNFSVGDLAIYNGTAWELTTPAAGVSSVNGAYGAVIMSMASANGFAGTYSGTTLTVSTTITGILQGNGTAISAASTTGSGAVVLATSPTLVTPNLGTPSTLVGTNITGTAASFTAGTVTTNANLTGNVTSVGNATSLVATSNATLTTLSALTTASSLSSVGTITSGTWNGTTIAIAHGGTGQTTAASAFVALSPLTTAGDIIYENATPAPARLAIGSTGQVLTVVSGLPAWVNPATNGTVTSVALSVPSFLSVSGSPITTSGTLAVTLSGTALPIANGGTGQTTAAAAYNALSPMTTTGDIEYESATNTASRLAIGTTGQVLTVVSGVPAWATAASSNGFLYLSSNTSVYGGTNTTLSFTGGHNTVVGVSAGNALAAGGNNSFFGWDAGILVSSGTDNTAIGQNALAAVTTHNGNTAIGSAALQLNTAANNTAVGNLAGASNTTGTIVAIGQNALGNNTQGTDNTAVGSSALGSNTVATDNTAIGFGSLPNLIGTITTGAQNTAVGSTTGGTLTSGHDNVFLGFTANSNSASSLRTIAIGSTTSSETDGIAIGSGQKNAFASIALGSIGSITATATTTAASQFSIGSPTVPISSMFLGQGAKGSATATNASIQPSPIITGTSNTAGATMTIAGGNSTGTGAGGSVIIQTAPAAGSSAATPNTLTTAVTVDSTQNVTIAGLAGTGTRPVAATSTGLLVASTAAQLLTAAGIRSGSQAISSAGTSVSVTFSSGLPSTSYSVTCNMFNSTDTNPEFQPITITAQSTTGFTATWNYPVATANYSLFWQAIVNN